MIEIRNDKLVIDGQVIGDEDKILELCDKAERFDEINTIFEGGDA